jgi:chromosome segregation ATPase
MKIFFRGNWGWVSAIVGIIASLIGVGMSYRGLTAQLENLQASVLKQDGRLNGHEARLKEVESSLMNLARIDDNIIQIREKSAAMDARMANLEKLVNLSVQVDINTKRLDKLETMMSDSARDRSALNAKLDQIQNSLSDLVRMHMTK